MTAIRPSQKRRVDGGVAAPPNRCPTSISLDDVDTLMWPIVSQINKSGWLWTTESCQGHGRMPVILGLVTDAPGRLFSYLCEAHHELLGANEVHSSDDPYGLYLTVKFWEQPIITKGKYQFRFVASSDQQELALQLFTELAQKSGNVS